VLPLIDNAAPASASSIRTKPPGASFGSAGLLIAFHIERWFGLDPDDW
jgi:hypothetical protein